MFDIILTKLKKWLPPVIAAMIIVFIGLAIWCTTTFQGLLWLDKMTGQVAPPQEKHCIKLYSAGELIDEYEGYYSVQQFDNHIVLLNHQNNDKVEVYGDTAVVINKKED